MKSKPLRGYALLCLVLLITTLVVYSCRKDTPTTGQQITLTSDEIGELQAIYSKGLVSGSGFATATANGSHFPNFVRCLNVKWNDYTVNNRPDGSCVIEFELKNDSSLFMLRHVKPGDSIYTRNRTSAVFIKRANGTRLNFFMKVIEDFSKTKHSVIGNLHYMQIPETFTGVVIYYTLDRKFINGNRFYNGRLVTALGSDSATSGGPAGNRQWQKNKYP